MIPISRPYLPSGSLRYAQDAISSGWISHVGRYVGVVTEKLKEIFGVKYVQLVNSGTAATHLLAKAIKLKHPSINKIIVPDNCYVAAWNSFLYDNEYTLLPISSDAQTWNINIEKAIEKSDHETALLAVHNIGNIIDISKIKGLVIVEDNCEGMFGKYSGLYSGTQSLASSLSFFANKTITSGEGGAVLTNDAEVYDHISSVRGQGQTDLSYVHDRLGYNYRMSNVQAAILLGQLEILDEILEKKNAIAERYRNELKHERIYFQEIDQNTSHSNWMTAIGIRNHQADLLMTKMKSKGIDTRRMFYPMSAHKHLAGMSNPEEEQVAVKLNRECIMLPSYTDLQYDEQSYIIRTICGVL